MGLNTYTGGDWKLAVNNQKIDVSVMNKVEQSIKQGQYKKPWLSFLKKKKFAYDSFWWNPGTGGQPKEMTGDSKILPIFPDYFIGGQGKIIRAQSYVRKQFRIRFKKVWYLIPIITQWESPTPVFGHEVITDVLKRHQVAGYKALLFYRFAKPMINENGLKLHTQLLDTNQEDEKSRLGIGL